jgi:small conductance mechanosensitive channel
MWMVMLAQATTAPVDTVTAVERTVGVPISTAAYYVETYGVPVVKAVVVLAVGLVVANWLARGTMAACNRAKFDKTLGLFLSSLVKWLIIAAVVIMCLSSFGVQVTSLVALLGTIGVAIGLAMQGSLSHIASGVMLLIFRPFKVGDFVKAGGETGFVAEINLFSTFLDTLDNRRIIVPNGAIVGGVITNDTHFPARVAEISVQSDKGAEQGRVREVLTAAASGVVGRIAEKPVEVGLAGTGGVSTWAVKVWCKSSEVDPVKERLLSVCYGAIVREGLAPLPPTSVVRNVQ